MTLTHVNLTELNHCWVENDAALSRQTQWFCQGIPNRVFAMQPRRSSSLAEKECELRTSEGAA